MPFYRTINYWLNYLRFCIDLFWQGAGFWSLFALNSLLVSFGIALAFGSLWHCYREVKVQAGLEWLFRR